METPRHVKLASPYGNDEIDRLNAALRDYREQVEIGGIGGTRPQRLGDYRVIEVIGEGGMGSVYKAEQLRPVRRTVAVKLVKPGLDSREVLARFEAERQALARMDHPHIAKVFDAGVDKLGRPFFVMEYVPGTPITRFCDEQRLGLPQRLELFCQVCHAIAHAHTKAVIHRDIKSSNVLAYLQDSKPLVKVIDFGVAKAITGDRLTDATFSTDGGSIIGTYDSMSPEQADGSRDIDTRTDVYSLGVLLYELLTGAKPFDHRTLINAPDHEIRRIIREVEPPKPASRLPSGSDQITRIANARQMKPEHLMRTLRGELAWIPLKAMRKQPDRRYASPLLLAEDVRNYLAGRPLGAGPESKIYVMRKFLRRHRAVALAVSIVLFLLALGATAYVHGIRAEQARTLAALREAQHQKRAADRQTAIAVAVKDFLSDMITAPKPERAQGEAVLVLDVVLRAADNIDEAFKDQPLIEAELRNTLADTLLSLGRPREAEEQLQRSLAIRQRELGPDDEMTLTSMYSLAQVLAHLSRPREAEAILRDASGRLQRTLGPDNARTLQAHNALATVLRELNRLDEAEPLMREVWQRRARLMGEDDPQALIAASNLAGILKDLGYSDEAETLYRRVLERRREVLGENHPATLAAMNNYATLLKQAGRLEEAEALFREALERHRRILPQDHPHLIGSMNNLASVLFSLGRLQEAETLAAEAVERNLRNIGADHRQTIMTQHLLAGLWMEMGRSTEAEALLRDVLPRAEKVLGPDHPETLRPLSTLARVWSRLNLQDQADGLYRDLIARHQRAFGENGKETLMIEQNYAQSLRDWGRFADAEAIYVRLFERVSSGAVALPAEQLARCRAHYALCVSEQSRWDDAHPLLVEAFTALRSTNQASSPIARAVVDRLVHDCQAAGRADEAREWKLLWGTLNQPRGGS